MVIGGLPGEGKSAGPSSAWGRIEAAQRSARLPCLLVPQPAHAVLAGEIAAGLVPASFGELPPEIVRAIQMHDTGWASSDAQQIQRLRSGGPQAGKAVPVSFVAIPPGEAAEAWTISIDTIEGWSKIGAIIVSRHFSLLAEHDQAHHQRFLQTERLRQRRLENSSMASSEDLERWTAALGFCDLVSLYLVSGLSSPVEYPLAHPSSPQAQTAPRVKMEMEGRTLRFTPEALQAGCTLSIQALKHPVSAQGARAETLTWEVQ
jgi:hypothetical protein